MQPLVKATIFKGDSKLAKQLAEATGMTIEEATASVQDEKKREQIWHNEKYQVAAIPYDDEQLGPCLQINIRRRDGGVIFRDWREFQDIKNQLAGPECEGIELYPAESRLIDTANKYHIWVILNPKMRAPFGWFDGRHVSDGSPKDTVPGIKQRPLPKHWKERK